MLPGELLDEIEGDLIQQFNRDVARYGRTNADQMLMWNTIGFFRPGFLLR